MTSSTNGNQSVIKKASRSRNTSHQITLQSL